MRPALYLFRCGKRLYPPYSAGVDHQKIFWGYMSHMPIHLVMSFENSPDEGDDHDTETEHVCRCARANEIVARLEHQHPQERPGGQPDGAREDPGVANQWLRCLPPHAYCRCAKTRRDRGASLPARCLARIAALQRARTRRACVDRGSDAGVRDPCARRRLSRAASAVHRAGASDAHLADRRHQRMEPDPSRLPRGPSGHTAPGGLRAAMSSHNAAAIFDPLRPRLIRIAYRMVGSVADAEDLVQEAFLRWLDADRDAVREPEAYLRRVVTRLCLDHLKSARHRRATYVGPWLPEPVVETVEDEVDDVTLPLMMALERQSPPERAAFLLHDLFGVSFEEIAETIGREPATCRQLASRARTHVRAARPRFYMPKERGLEIAAAFFAASRSGNMQELQSLLAADVTVYSDGGGKKPAAMHPIFGFVRVMQFHASLAQLFA